MKHAACSRGFAENKVGGNKHDEVFHELLNIPQQPVGKARLERYLQSVNNKLTFVGRLIPATELHPGELLFSTTFMAKSTALKPTAQVL